MNRSIKSAGIYEQKNYTHTRYHRGNA